MYFRTGSPGGLFLPRGTQLPYSVPLCRQRRRIFFSWISRRPRTSRFAPSRTVAVRALGANRPIATAAMVNPILRVIRRTKGQSLRSGKKAPRELYLTQGQPAAAFRRRGQHAVAATVAAKFSAPGPRRCPFTTSLRYSGYVGRSPGRGQRPQGTIGFSKIRLAGPKDSPPALQLRDLEGTLESTPLGHKELIGNYLRHSHPPALHFLRSSCSRRSYDGKGRRSDGR